MTDPELVMESVRCAMRGYHMRLGSANGTNSENVLWADYCCDCFTPLRLVARAPKIGKQSACASSSEASNK